MQNTVKSKQNQLKTVNDRQNSISTFHLFTADRNIFKQILNVLAVGEACVAILGPTPGFKGRPLGAVGSDEIDSDSKKSEQNQDQSVRRSRMMTMRMTLILNENIHNHTFKCLLFEFNTQVIKPRGESWLIALVTTQSKANKTKSKSL